MWRFFQVNRHFLILLLIRQLTFFCLLCLAYHATAQDCNESIFGVVYDLHDNIPLQGVTITLLENDRKVQTTANGTFVFPALCQQGYTLLLEHPDCSPITTKNTQPSSILKKFYLEHHLNELEEIIITDQGQKKTTKTGIESSLSKEELKRFHSQNLGDALAQLAGVSSIKTGNAIVKPMVHGVTGSRIAIINDGIRLQDHEWGADHAPSIDINGADQVQLIKGATALQFGGDALGGIIQLIPQKYPLSDSLLGSISSGYVHQGKGGYLLTDITKTFTNGTYFGGNTSLKNTGDLKNPNYILSNTGNREQHAKVYFGRNTITQEWRFNYSFFQKEAGILAAAHIGTVGDLARSIESTQPLFEKPWTRSINNPKQSTVHHGLSVRYDRRMTNQAKWDIQYSFQANNRKEFDVRRGEANNRAALDIELLSHDMLFNFRSKQENSLRWQSGLSAQLQDNFVDPNTGVRRLIPDYLRYKFGIYTISEYAPSNNFSAEVGLRFDYDYIDAQKYYRIADWNAREYNDDFAHTIISTGNASNYLTRQIKKFGNFSASAGIKQWLGKQTNAYLNLGFITRSPNPSELFSDGLHHALATIEQGDLRLSQERAIKGVFSLAKKNDRFTYTLSGYYSRVKDYILLQPSEQGFDQARNSAFLMREYTQLDQVNLLGIDADLSISFGKHLAYQATAAWVSAQSTTGEPLIDTPPLNISQEIFFQMFKKRPLSLRLSSQYQARQTQFPDYNFSYTFIENGVLTERIIDISSPPKAFHLMHLSLETRIKNNIEVRLVTENIFDVDYRNYLNRLRYFAGETGRNIRLEFSYIF